MPFFAYKGRNGRGDMLQGVLEGVDSGAVANQLFSTGITNILTTTMAAIIASTTKLG